jgi:hypothetical protein
LSGLFSAAGAEPDPRTPYHWRQPLLGDFVPGQLYRVPVTGPVFDGSAHFPSDLRVFDAEGAQWPFYVWTPHDEKQRADVPVERLNTTEVMGPERYLRQDLRVQPDPRTGKAARHNRVTLHTPGRDFIRRVEVYGSEDGDVWGRIGAGFLLETPGSSRTRNRSIDYGTSDYPYLQVRVYPNARNAEEPLSIERIHISHSRVKPGQWVEVPLTATELRDEKPAPHAQVLLFDTGAKGQPVERLSVRGGKADYVRFVRVYGRDSGTNSWRVVGSGEIHRLGKHMREHLSLRDCAYRFLKVEITHYDDPSFTEYAVRAEAVSRFLVVEAREGTAPALYYGARRIRAATYDLRRRRGPGQAATSPMRELGAREPSVLHRRVGFGPWGRWLAALAVGAVSILVVAVIVSMLKQQGSQAGISKSETRNKSE